MSNSTLVTHINFSPNKTVNRKYKIDRISPHCVVGQVVIESLGNWFALSKTQASSNYGIDKNGRVGLFVDEKDRSWCTSSADNDHRAITIECASDMTHPYAMNEVVYQKLIDLCVDICKRNGKTKLIWFGDKTKTLNYKPASNEMLITVHRWFANKSCPGDWLYSRLGDLAAKVTAKLNSNVANNQGGNQGTASGTNDALYRVQAGAFSSISNAVEHQEKLKKAGLINTYLVKANDGLYKVQTGAYRNRDSAISEVNKLKAAGFGAFVTTETGTPVSGADIEKAKNTIKKGDIVRVQKNAPVYGKSYGFQNWVYQGTFIVRGIEGNRVTISTVATGPITGAVDKKYLTKV